MDLPDQNGGTVADNLPRLSLRVEVRYGIVDFQQDALIRSSPHLSSVTVNAKRFARILGPTVCVWSAAAFVA